MNFKMNSILLVAVLTLVILSCQMPVGLPEGGSTADFPNRIGDQWTYQYYDSLRQRSDTVVVTIVGQTTIPGNKTATIWQKVYRIGIDTVYVTVSGDTVKILPKYALTAQWINTKYIFPLLVGRGWRGDISFDTNTIADMKSISVIAGKFLNAYRIEERWGGYNEYGRVTTWFVPRVGAATIHRREWGWGFVNETWELIDYHVLP